jgi:GWxTD domain-containing protein
MVFLLVVPIACASSQKSTVKPSVLNLSNMYNPTNTRIHPAYTVYHDSPNTSQLLIKIFPSELLYSGTIEPNKLLGQVKLIYRLIDITNEQQPAVADSGSIIYRFERENADKRFQTQLSLNTQIGKKYQLSLTASDMVRKSETLSYLYVDKSAAITEQSFMVTSIDEKSTVYKPYVVGNNTIKLACNLEGYDSVFVKYYGSEMPLPRPSFSLSREKEFFDRPDSIWILPLNKATAYQLNYEGVYFIQPDTTIGAGLTLLNFGTEYPRVQQVEQLIKPLAYLATTTEYNELQQATNKKLAVDNFWLDKAGNIEKARELIRVYYNRVYFANYYFTSFKPGWKTDRGMIFIIYGPPQSVKVSTTQEKWIYYKNNYSTSVTFTFDHNPIPFSFDNYTLQRSDSYDTFWRSAVDTWRRGNIYMIE